MVQLPDDASSPSDETSAETYARARRWQTIWPQIIAMAWKDKSFKDKLIADPRGVIQQEFGYPLSQELELSIEESPANTPPYNPNAEQGADRWRGLEPMKLKLYIPPAPGVEDQAIAITHYSETGRTYPMTSG